MARTRARTWSFWLSFAYGYLVVLFILAMSLSLVPLHAFSGLKALALGVAAHSLSAAGGLWYARSRVRKVEPPGFPVIQKRDGDSGAA